MIELIRENASSDAMQQSRFLERDRLAPVATIVFMDSSDGKCGRRGEKIPSKGRDSAPDCQVFKPVPGMNFPHPGFMIDVHRILVQERKKSAHALPIRGITGKLIHQPLLLAT
jgi:hypothetical protein